MQDDQKHLAELLEPYFDASKQELTKTLDESVLLYKKGLDFRLLEFEEDCRRIQQTERALQRKIEDCTLTYEASLVETKNLAEQHLLAQIYEQQKVIQCQQIELDELRFQRDLYADESFRLRQLCRYGDFRPLETIKKERSYTQSPRSMHQKKASVKPQFEWMDNIKRNPKEILQEPEPIRKSSIVPTGVQLAKRPWVLSQGKKHEKEKKNESEKKEIKNEIKKKNESEKKEKIKNEEPKALLVPQISAKTSEQKNNVNEIQHFLSVSPISKLTSQTSNFEQTKSAQSSFEALTPSVVNSADSEITSVSAALQSQRSSFILPENELQRLKGSGVGLPLGSSRRKKTQSSALDYQKVLTVRPNQARKSSQEVSSEAISRFLSSANETLYKNAN